MKYQQVVDIRDLGETLITSLFKDGRLKSISDIYSLQVEDLVPYFLNEESMEADKKSLGAEKVYNSIQNHRRMRLATFIGAFDIEGIEEYYVLPSNNAFFVAYDGDKIVATAAIRAYDKDYELFRGIYTKEDTASIWRLMVDEKYRRHGLARRLVGVMEDFARKKGYDRVYLHTHRYLEAAIAFWESVGYEITVQEDDYDETNHMIKVLN